MLLAAQKPIRHLTVTPKATSVDNIAFTSSVCKIIANTVTYPLESYRLLILDPRQNKISISKLLTGITTYLPFCVTTNFIMFKLFYGVQTALAPLLQLHHTAVLGLAAATITSIVTSFYRIPYSYYIKNKLINDHVDFKLLYSPPRYQRSLVATLCEDIPELMMRTSLTQTIITYLCSKGCNSFQAYLGVSIIASAILCPLDYTKTKILCMSHLKPLSVQSVGLAAIITALRIMLFNMLMNVSPSL